MNKVVNILKKFLRLFSQEIGNSENTKVLSSIEMLRELDCLEYDLGELREFLERSDISAKLALYHFDTIQKEETSKIEKILTDNEISLIAGFLTLEKKERTHVLIEKFVNFVSKLISGSVSDTKVILQLKDEDSTPKNAYLIQLDLKDEFQSLFQEGCRSILFTGGTMEPSQTLEVMLGRTNKKIVKRSFSHVVSNENIMLSCVSEYRERKFKFTFQNREDNEMYIAAAKFVLEIGTITSAFESGTIVFVPSYKIQSRLKLAIMGLKPSLMILFDEGEPEIFSKFSKSIISKKIGGVLFSVMGGSLSEGINFKDDLARAVICIGLPYPNSRSSKLRLKMKYFDECSQDLSGDEYYESLCSKSVNQAIGRAIRHKNDFASIFLLDNRYNSEQQLKRLPSWMINSRCKESKGEAILLSFSSFLRSKKLI